MMAAKTTNPTTEVSSVLKKWRSISPPMRLAWKPMRRMSGAAKIAWNGLVNTVPPQVSRRSAFCHRRHPLSAAVR
jgi:hypothetical protein